MNRVVVFLSFVFVFVFCVSCSMRRTATEKATKNQSENSRSGRIYEEDEYANSEYAFMKLENLEVSVDYDKYEILLYEGSSTKLQTFQKSQLESKQFEPGTTVKLGVVFYKNGSKIAESDDSKSKCNYTKATLQKGKNQLSVVACKIGSNNNVVDTPSTNPPSDDSSKTDTTTNTTCSNSQENYSTCVFQESINSNDSFYSQAIKDIGSCSNLSEIVCYKKNDGKKVVVLACASKDDVKENSSNSCFTKDNKVVISGSGYSAVRIGEVQVL